MSARRQGRVLGWLFLAVAVCGLGLRFAYAAGLVR